MSNLETSYQIYDPRGVVEAEPRPVSKRAGSLKGLRVGVLEHEMER